MICCQHAAYLSANLFSPAAVLSSSLYLSLAVDFDTANCVLSVKMALIFTFLLRNLLLEIVKRVHTTLTSGSIYDIRHCTDVG
jgi:hypothetical protein